MQDLRDAEFVGMHQNTDNLLENRCVRNWHGSAKAMEPDMFVKMVNDIIKKGVPIAKVAGDDDHTGINRVHQEGETNIEKESDKNLFC